MNSKHSFWQALIVAIIIFWTGIMLGILFENSRTSKLENFYKSSETQIFDIQLTGNLLMNEANPDCNTALQDNIDFADRIYEEAKTLEKYDASNKITDDIVKLHSRYDLLRTMLWLNVIGLQEKCSNQTNIVVYLYQYVEPNIDTQAKQVAISKVTSDLKKKYGDKVLLIPLAYDTGVKSLSLLRSKYQINEFPVVIVNQKNKITGLNTVEELEKYLEL